MAAQSELVSCGTNRAHIQLVIVGNGCQVDQNKQLEQSWVFSGFRDLENIDDFAVFVDVIERPVVVFSTAIHVLEGFLVE